MKLPQFLSRLFEKKQQEVSLSDDEKDLPKRQYHLGLDWGTSATKLILRDYAKGETAFVLCLDKERRRYRCPSTVVMNNWKLYFGFESITRRAGAQVVVEAIKKDIYRAIMDKQAVDDATEKEELATLYLAHIISAAVNRAEEHATRAGEKAVMGMTLGVPAEELEQSKLRNAYVLLARTAYELAVNIGYDPQGKSYAECKHALKDAKERINQRDSVKSPGDSIYAQWLRPELAAAMYWAVKSPKIQSDLYTCVDIGAWTTNASYFRIHDAGQGQKGIAFYGGACSPPGMIRLLEDIGRKQVPSQEYFQLFDKEDHYLRNPEYKNDIESFRDDCFTVWESGFGKAYEKEKVQSAWDGKLNVMVVGGGSKVQKVKEIYSKRFPNVAWRAPKPVIDLGMPTDLYEFPKEGVIPRNKFAGDDHLFFLVAYGLSVHSMDFPETTLAPQVKPFTPSPRIKYKPYENDK